MKLPDLLTQLFTEGSNIVTTDWLVTGEATVAGKPVSILGTTNHTFIGVREAVVLSEKFLDIAERFPGMPILMLVDNNGQRMALDEELLVLPEYIAHLLKAGTGHARLAGCKPLIADRLRQFNSRRFHRFRHGGGPCCLRSRGRDFRDEAGGHEFPRDQNAIGKTPGALASKVSVFAPGSENFYKMGGIYEMWTDQFPARLQHLIASDISKDLRVQLGHERGGREAAQSAQSSKKMSFTPELDQFRRHSFAWITDVRKFLDNLLQEETPLNDVICLRNWLGRGRPLIIRRPCRSEDGKSVYVGLSLPPDPVKRRLAFRLPFSSLANVVEPPLWTECAEASFLKSRLR